MAITKTRKLDHVEVYAAIDSSAADSSNTKHARVRAEYIDTLDDSEDADLPVSVGRTVYITKFVKDGGAATDYSKEDALVKTICAAVWS
tara:strand:+ start:686 stop:952 length:267 start_codon:yes stop_codon:yes gene_type:complete